MTRIGECVYVYNNRLSIKEKLQLKYGKSAFRKLEKFAVLAILFFVAMAYCFAPMVFDQRSKEALKGLSILNKTQQGAVVRKKVPDVISESLQKQSLFSRDEKRMLKSYGVSRVQVGQNKQPPFLSQSQFEQIAAVYNIPIQKYAEFWSKPNCPQKQAVAVTVHKGINPGLYWKSIAQLNGIKNPGKDLKAGMTIKVPVDPNNLDLGGDDYQVKSGDTLWDLAVQHYDNGGAKNQVP